MSELQRPDLWKLLLPTILAAREAGLERLASGSYVTRHRMPRLETNSAGWPQCLDRDLQSPTQDDPLDWKGVFQQKPDGTGVLPIVDIPAMRRGMDSVIELSARDEEVRDFISLLARVFEDDPDKVRSQIEHELLSLIGDILSRADALGAGSDDELREIYRELERGRFATELTGDILAPLLLTPFAENERREIGPGIWLEPLDDNTQRVRAPGVFSGYPPPFLLAAATHAVVIKDVTVPNVAWSLDRFVSRFRPDMTAVAHFASAIMLATGTHSGYAEALLRPQGWASEFRHGLAAHSGLEVVAEYPATFDSVGWNQAVEPIDADKLTQAIEIFAELQQAPENVKLAARRHRRSNTRLETEDEILDAVIGIEALLGEGRTELTHRMGLRAAVALSDSLEAPRTYHLLKDVYKQRSTIVHGGQPKSSQVMVGGVSVAAYDIARVLLEKLLQSCLTSDPIWTPGMLDEVVLERIGRPASKKTNDCQVDQ